MSIDLETFLSGMETGVLAVEVPSKGLLETFLSGLETGQGVNADGK